jgi:ligand-binding SRPBCC domain-containing protein
LTHVLARTQRVRAPIEETFAFFANPRNLETITPPWLRFRIVDAPNELTAGARLAYRLRLFGAPISWLTEITDWRPPRTFTDVQLEGPYVLWEHTHRLTPAGAETEIYDHVRYRLPFEPLASLARRFTVERWLGWIFDYRALQIDELFSAEAGRRARHS